MSVLTRPANPKDNKISYAKTETSIYELIFRQDQLQFAFQREGKILYDKEAGVYTPLEWIEGLVQHGMIALPSGVEPFGTIDELAAEIRGLIHRYFDCPSEFETVAVLFVLMTWLIEAFHAVPYLRFYGAPGTGKSRGSDVIGSVCYRKVMIAGAATPAPMFRMIDAIGGTLIIDEADFHNSQVGSDIAKVLNCGYRHGSSVVRMEKDKKGNFEPRCFDVFGPKIINGRVQFGDEATESRCLTLVTRETERSDIPTQLPAEFFAEAAVLRNRLLSFRFAYLNRGKMADQHIEGVGRRTNEIILPLLFIADQLQEPRYRMDLLTFAHEIDAKTRKDRGQSLEAMVVEAYVILTASGEQVTPGQVKDEILQNRLSADDPDAKGLSARKVGSFAKGLGFETNKKAKGWVLSIGSKQLAALCQRYMITQPSLEGHQNDHSLVTIDDGSMTVKKAA